MAQAAGAGQLPRRSMSVGVAASPPPGQDGGGRWAPVGTEPIRPVAAASALVVDGDLLDEVDDAAPQLGVADARERFGERQSVRRRKKIGHVGRRRRVPNAFVTRATRWNVGRTLEKE